MIGVIVLKFDKLAYAVNIFQACYLADTMPPAVWVCSNGCGLELKIDFDLKDNLYEIPDGYPEECFTCKAPMRLIEPAFCDEQIAELISNAGAH